jgi:peptide chain release factor 1
MKPFVRDQLQRYADRLGELDFLLSRPDVMADMTQFMALSREHTEVAAVAGRWARYQQRERDLGAAQDMLADPDMAELAREEIAAAQAELAELDAELQRMLLPKDPDDARNAFLEIRAGTGGDESALFAGDLARMYTRYAQGRGWRVEVMSESPAELGGYKEVVLRIAGEGVYGLLRFESGGHRVQRVPVTETQGRIHTSAATVAVMPEPDEAQAITLNPADLRIDTFRASGAAASTSTRPIRPCAWCTCPPAWWPSARTGAASTPTRRRRCACCRRACRTRSAASAPPRRPPRARA